MTDLYVRRGDTPDVRRRVTIILVMVIALAALGVGLRYGCSRQEEPVLEEEPLPDLLQVEGNLEDELGLAPSARPAPNPKAPTPSAPGADRDESASAPPRPATESAPPSRGSGDLLVQAEQLHAAGEYQEARELCQRVLETQTSEAARNRALQILGGVGMELLLTPRPMPEKIEYTVKSGDSLARLAKQFHTTIELIRKSNDIRGSIIRVGDRLRIFDGTFSVRIDKSDCLLDLYLDDRLFKRYRVGTGEYNRTPVGDFTITDRIPQPTWWRPDGKAIPYGDPENELGTHWLSLDIRGYGIHGTWEPETIGRQASAGCVRLLNEEIEELYSILPVGTPVTIVD